MVGKSKNMVTETDFLAYEEARKSGKYNMVLDAYAVMKDYGIEKSVYINIITNYGKYAQKYLN